MLKALKRGLGIGSHSRVEPTSSLNYIPGASAPSPVPSASVPARVAAVAQPQATYGQVFVYNVSIPKTADEVKAYIDMPPAYKTAVITSFKDEASRHFFMCSCEYAEKLKSVTDAGEAVVFERRINFNLRMMNKAFNEEKQKPILSAISDSVLSDAEISEAAQALIKKQQELLSLLSAQ